MRDRITVTATKEISAPPENVFDAWLDPRTARRFLFATPEGEMVRCEIDARVGGRYVLTEKRGEDSAEHGGLYTAIERPYRLEFTFGVPAENPDKDPVEVAIEEIKSGSRITLSHHMKAEWAEWAEKTREGWQHILNSLSEIISE